jgi:tetratricopeptide (TPR) repeat protein
MENIPQPQQGDNGERWLAYGNQLSRTGQLDKSVVAFDRAIALNQKLLGNYGKALSLQSTGKYRLAENAIAQAIAAIPPKERAKYYYLWKEQSSILINLGKYDEALKAIDLAIGLERNDLTLLNQKAGVLAVRKQYVLAISIYDEIISKQPEVYAYFNRGFSKDRLGNKQEAIVDLDLAISLNPKFANAYKFRGNIKSELGKNRRQ